MQENEFKQTKCIPKQKRPHPSTHIGSNIRNVKK